MPTTRSRYERYATRPYRHSHTHRLTYYIVAWALIYAFVRSWVRVCGQCTLIFPDFMILWNADNDAKTITMLWTAIRRIFYDFPREALPKISVPPHLSPENQESVFRTSHARRHPPARLPACQLIHAAPATEPGRANGYGYIYRAWCAYYGVPPSPLVADLIKSTRARALSLAIHRATVPSSNSCMYVTCMVSISTIDTVESGSRMLMLNSLPASAHVPKQYVGAHTLQLELAR